MACRGGDPVLTRTLAGSNETQPSIVVALESRRRSFYGGGKG